jgi:hypothetical protein
MRKTKKEPPIQPVEGLELFAASNGRVFRYVLKETRAGRFRPVLQDAKELLIAKPKKMPLWPKKSLPQNAFWAGMRWRVWDRYVVMLYKKELQRVAAFNDLRVFLNFAEHRMKKRGTVERYVTIRKAIADCREILTKAYAGKYSPRENMDA